jgi:hypothetical protein
MKIEQLSKREIATILAALRFFQREAEKFNMVEAFPEYFECGELTPLGNAEIDALCEDINTDISTHAESAECRWNQLVATMNFENNSPLTRLTLHLNCAVEDENLSHEQAFEVLEGERGWIFDIDCAENRDAAIAAFDELEEMRGQGVSTPFSQTFSAAAFKDVAYVTREFVRADCSIHGASFSDADCDTIIAEVQKLAQQGNFHHAGVYWIANRLTAEGQIHPTMS